MNEALVQKVLKVKAAARELVRLNTRDKNKALSMIAEEIDNQRESIKIENTKDLQNGIKKGLNKAFLDRLELTDKRIDEMIKVQKAYLPIFK